MSPVPVVNEAHAQEIHVLFEHGFTLQISTVIYMTLYAESAVDQTDHFADAFVHENIWYVYDVVMTLESLQSTPFCLEKFSARKWIF